MNKDFDWFRVDNLKPELRYGYPSTVPESTVIGEVNMDWKDFSPEEQRVVNVFNELRAKLKEENLDDNKIVVGYRRQDNNEMVYIGWKDSYRKIGTAAYNRDGAEPTRPWD